MKYFTSIILAITITLLLTSCQNDEYTPNPEHNLNQNSLNNLVDKIVNMGFQRSKIELHEGRFIIEKDIIIEQKNLNSSELKSKQFHTFPTFKFPSNRTQYIDVRIDTKFHQDIFSATEIAVNKYNQALRNTNIKLRIVTTLTPYPFPENTIGRTFITTTTGRAQGSLGLLQPDGKFRFGEFILIPEGAKAINKDFNSLAAGIIHELGHNLGFRHTDSNPSNIPGTPNNDSSSIMNSSPKVDNLSEYDLIAIDKTFGNNPINYPESWNKNYVENKGWRVDKNPRVMGDVNGDGKADIIGFGNNDILVALSDGDSFENPKSWKKTMTYDDGWRADKHIRTVADVNGDGKADLIGFGNNDVLIALSDGNKFQTAKSWKKTMTYNDGWRVNKNPRIVADVNGDGKADIIGFGNNDVLIALSDGNKFKTAKSWTKNFTYSDGWRTDNHTRTVADVNGDGKADIIGFGTNDVLVALSNGSNFEISKSWQKTMTFNEGWRVNKNPRGVADVNGDGKADLIGFGNYDVLISLSNGKNFQTNELWINDFGYNSGNWKTEKNPRRISDINGDGKADIIGFGDNDVMILKSDIKL